MSFRLNVKLRPHIGVWKFVGLAGLSLLLSLCLYLWQIAPNMTEIAFLPPPSAIADAAWAQASFPVAQFEAYSSLWGWRSDPFTGGQKLHRGLDIVGPEGSAIVAWWAGKVITVASQPEGCGNYVLIQSGNWEHLYCHNQAVLVQEGDIVQVGQVIAKLGNTGRSSGAHCHFELWLDGKNLDPSIILQLMYQAQSQGQRSVSYELPVDSRVAEATPRSLD